jgi:RsmE family RNA methyltransferase
MPRLFVPPGACEQGRLRLEGADARRLYRQGLRPGDEVAVLDGSGWEITARLQDVEPEACSGQLTGRRLAQERRTQVSVYHALLHPSDFRRLLSRATALGAVAFVPVIADGSVVPPPAPPGTPDRAEGWARVVRDAAETSGRGRQPVLGQTMLFDHALDAAGRAGRLLMLDRSGGPLAPQLEDRPFTVALLCPPPGGFSAAEIARATARGAQVVQPAGGNSADPVQPAIRLIERIYEALEDGTAAVG